MSDRMMIEPQRLDLVLAESASQADAPAYIREFEALLRAGRRGVIRGTAPSLQDSIIDTVMPHITDPSIFQGSRFTTLLEGLSGQIGSLFSEDEAGEVHTVIQEELIKYWAVQDRRKQGIPL